MTKWIVYVLKNPRTNAVRYVGWTSKSPDKRLQNHIAEAAATPPATHKRKWILSLLSIGLHPLIEVVESGCGDGWAEAERRWIAHYRALGANLVNGTEGGEGALGRGTPELRSAIARKGNASRTPEQIRAAVEKQKAAMPFERRSAIVTKWHATKTPEERSAVLKKANAARTPEQRRASATKILAKWGSAERSECAKENHARKTPEERSAIVKKANASRTPEQRHANAKKIHANMTPAERSAIGAKANAEWTRPLRSASTTRWQAAKTPEERSAAAKKGHETRKQKAAELEKLRGDNAAKLPVQRSQPVQHVKPISMCT